MVERVEHSRQPVAEETLGCQGKMVDHDGDACDG